MNNEKQQSSRNVSSQTGNAKIQLELSYIKLVKEVREAQNTYFEAALQARKLNTPAAWGEKKDKLLQSKALEYRLDKWTRELLDNHLPGMTAEQAIAQMKLNLGLEESRG